MKNNYYSDYDLSTFFDIPALSEKISETSFNKELLNAALFFCINRERVKFNRRLLKFHPMLQEMAQLHSEQMKKHDFFDHENPYNARYKTLVNRIRFLKLKYKEIKELHLYEEHISDRPIFDTDKVTVLHDIMFFDDGSFYSVYGGAPEEKVFTYLEFASRVVLVNMNYPNHGKFILNRELEFLGCGTEIYKRCCHDLSVCFPSIKITLVSREDLKK